MYRLLTIIFFLSALVFGQKAPAGNVNVLTRQNDNQHTGQNLQETILSPSNVNPGGFGKLFSYYVDGQVYAQPLYVQNLTMAQGGVHNVVLWRRSTTASTRLTPTVKPRIPRRFGM